MTTPDTGFPGPTGELAPAFHPIAEAETACASLAQMAAHSAQKVEALEAHMRDSRAMQKELEESREHLRITLDSIGDAVIVTDTRGVVSSLNPVAAKLTGWSAAQAVGRPLDEVFHIINAQTVRQVDNPVPKVLAEGVAVGLAKHTVLVSLSGDRHHIADSAAPILGADGSVQGVVLVFRDVTEEYRTHQELQQQRAFLRLLIDQTPNQIFWKDRHLTYLGCNQMFATVTGMGSPEKVVGMTDCDFQRNQADTEAYRKLDRKIMETGEPVLGLEEHYFTAEGEEGYVLTNKVPIRNADQEIIGVLGTCTDITERKRVEAERANLQAQLAQAQKMESVGRLAGGVAHDFNNMLGVILCHADLLLEQVSSDDPLHAGLEEIRKAAQRSAELTRQLLAFARKQTIAPKVLDLNDTVEGMLKMLRRLIGEDIALDWKPGPGLWTIKMDPTQIDQILVNLCVNARDAIAGVGRITVETRNVALDEAYCAQQAGFSPGEYVTLIVNDDGCGMDSKTLALLFEPFFTTKPVGQGTGLGLATVYGIVRQNHGFIDVSSEPGRGATFHIYLPRHAALDVPLPEMPPPRRASSGHETILLVEDEPPLRPRYLPDKEPPPAHAGRLTPSDNESQPATEAHRLRG